MRALLGCLLLTAVVALATGGSTTGLNPLTAMTGEQRYQGFDGGLYGQGRNQPPEPQAAAARAAAARIRPLDRAGQPAADGRVVLVSVGMSNTTQEFSAFQRLAATDDAKSRHLTLVDGAQGGQEASAWARSVGRAGQDRPTPWEVLNRRLTNSGVTAQQVQVAWIKQARAQPARLGAFPAHARALTDDLTTILVELKRRFPNLQLAFLSSRIYAGYATTALNPEPYAYESAFSVRQVIEGQMAGKAELNAAPEKGAVTVPVLLWGPYLWADGAQARADGLTWIREDFGPDGTHPSNAGREKVARMLLAFFKTDPAARPWFTAD